jgi:hypothetical protein
MNQTMNPSATTARKENAWNTRPKEPRVDPDDSKENSSHETETFFYRAALTGLEALAQTISLVVLYLSQSLPSNDSEFPLTQTRKVRGKTFLVGEKAACACMKMVSKNEF